MFWVSLFKAQKDNNSALTFFASLGSELKSADPSLPCQAEVNYLPLQSATLPSGLFLTSVRLRLNIHSFNLEVSNKLPSANRELGTMNKEMERNDQLSLVLYILVVQEILIKLHLGPNREAYSTQKGRT